MYITNIFNYIHFCNNKVEIAYYNIIAYLGDYK